MSSDRPKNLLRTSLTVLGIALYRLGLARPIISLSKNRVRAMLYHAVEDKKNSFTHGLNVSVSPHAFSANLDYFKQFYNVIPVSQLHITPLPKNPLVITFDDGYHSVYEHAVPALHEREMSACIYLISRAVRGDLVWVNLVNYTLRQHPKRTANVLQSIASFADTHPRDVIAQLQSDSRPEEIAEVYDALMREFPELSGSGLYASVDEIHEMIEKGIEFGFHTADHFNLQNCNSEEIAAQLDAGEVKALLSNDTFAYPFGYYNQNAIDQLDAQNYETVMTVGNNNNMSYNKHLDRVEVFTSDPAKVFAQLEIVEPLVSWLRRKLLRSPAQTPGYEIPEPIVEETRDKAA